MKDLKVTLHLEAVAQRCSIKMILIKISEKKKFLNKIEDYRLTAISEKRLWHRSLPAKFLRISFSRKTSG